MSLLKPLYATALFVSAFLMFSVQPMIGKALLPLMGGGPSVWNIAMVFFQLLLLAGYFYAFLLSKLKSVRDQGAVHALVIIIAAAISLPLSLQITEAMPSKNPAGWQIWMMTGMVAAPFFALSASAPLLQRWFSLSSHTKAASPYSLYVASNIGSLLALLAYPFVIERFLRLDTQAMLWSYVYALLAVVLVMVFNLSGFLRTHKTLPKKLIAAKNVASVTWPQRLIWLFLAFVPSSLMLGFTSYMTTDVTSAPLFWVVPLALYLISFIIAFSDHPILKLETSRSLHAVILMCFLWLVMAVINPSRLPIVLVHGALFFITALVCHQELARAKPHAKHLTEFYLFLSLGGALGGIFNSLIAPLIFSLPYEYMLAVVLGIFARQITDPSQSLKATFGRALKSLGPQSDLTLSRLLLFPGLMFLGVVTAVSTIHELTILVACVTVLLVFLLHNRRWAFGLTILAIVICNPLIPWKHWSDKILIERNFFGVHIVSDEDGLRKLTHGTTIHGAQARGTPFETIPITYYYAGGGAEDVFSFLDTREGPQRIAAMGLGAGSIACFWKGERRFDFYEIDPAVIKIASNPDYFTYLSKCMSKYSIVVGDARQKIAEAPQGFYDMIFIDVFSSDNIPLHIMTLEAVGMYRSKLKPGGMLVFHTSNRFFSLEPEIAAIGKALNMNFLFKVNLGGIIPNSEIQFFPTRYAVLTDNQQTLSFLAQRNWGKLSFEVTQEPWSDAYADVLRAMRF